jgi:peptide/nickel transport system substrate-binding protein
MANNYWDKVLTRRVGRRRAIAGTGATALGAAFLAACGGDDDDDDDGGAPSSSPSTGSGSSGSSGSSGGGTVIGKQFGNHPGHSLLGSPDAKYGGTFGTFVSDAPHLDIYTTAHEYSSLSGQYVFDHMITTRQNENAPWVAEAAEGVEENPDGITYTFKLRQGMKYHNFAPVNGREVVASDIVADQEYVKTVAGAENAFQNEILDKAEAPDDYTVVYTLQRPTAYLYTARLFGHPGPQSILPKEYLEVDRKTHQQIGSGPFILDDYVVATRWHYVRNPEYHSRGLGAGIMPYRDAQDCFFISDEAAREAAFRSEQATFYQPAAASFQGIVDSLPDLARGITGPGLQPFTWNLGNAPDERKLWIDYKDTRFREAIYRLTDKQQFVDLVYQGNAKIPTSILAVAQPAIYQLDASETEEYFKYDVAEAKKLLEAVGYDGREYQIEYQGSATAGQACEVLKQQLAQGGVNTAIFSRSPSELLERSTRGEYDFFVGGHPRYDSPQAPLNQNKSNTKLAFGGTSLNDPELDAMILKAEQTPNLEEGAVLVKQILLELCKRYTVYYNIMSPDYQAVVNAKIQNWETDQSPGVSPHAESWFA